MGTCAPHHDPIPFLSLNPTHVCEWGSALAAPHPTEGPPFPGGGLGSPLLLSSCAHVGTHRSWSCIRPSASCLSLSWSQPRQWQESLSPLVSVLCAASGGPHVAFILVQQTRAPAYAPALGSGAPSPSQVSCLSTYAPPCTCEGVAECTPRAGKQGCLHLLAPGHMTGFCEDHMCSGGQEGWRCHPGNVGRRRKGRV